MPLPALQIGWRTTQNDGRRIASGRAFPASPAAFKNALCRCLGRLASAILFGLYGASEFTQGAGDWVSGLVLQALSGWKLCLQTLRGKKFSGFRSGTTKP